MRATRETRFLKDVVEEAKYTLIKEYNYPQSRIDAEIARIEKTGKQFAFGSYMYPIDKLTLDYTVQRDIDYKHIIKIISRYNPQLCAPASAVTDDIDNEDSPISVYDGQHRIVASAVLGYTEVPITIVEDDRPSFASYAFEECNTNVKALEPKDFYRNRLTRYHLGDRSAEVVQAYVCEQAFNNNDADLEDKGTRKSKNKGSGKHFFSHFNYAEKIMNADKSGKLMHKILNAISTVYPDDEEISQDLFIGLFIIHCMDHTGELPEGWMIDVLEKCAISYPTSLTVMKYSLYKSKADTQKQHTMPGHKWQSSIMGDFLRELYMYNGGTLNLPSEGGSIMQLDTNQSPLLFTAA